MLDGPIVERAAQRGCPIGIGQTRITVEGRGTGEQRNVDIPAVEVFLLQKLQLKVEIPRIAAGEFLLYEFVLRDAALSDRCEHAESGHWNTCRDADPDPGGVPDRMSTGTAAVGEDLESCDARRNRQSKRHLWAFPSSPAR